MCGRFARWLLGASMAMAFSTQGYPQPVTSAPSPQDTATIASPYYLLGPQDVIGIELLGASGFKLNQIIKPDGTIEVPLLRNVTATGKTILDLRDQISRDLESGGFVLHPIVIVTLVSPVRSVVVLGAVANPGLIPIDRPYHLSEILARVGGVRENGADYVILRPEKGEQRRLSIQALATGDASQDPLVAPGDKIFSPKAEVFYISGQIKLPGAYPLSPDMTLRMAIARGGGLTETGSENRVTITRHNADLDRAALNGKIEPDDVIVVGQSFF